MKLQQYLARNSISYTQFAHTMGVEPPTAFRWATGLRTPSLRIVVEIEDYTKGQVTVRDWIEDAKSE